MIEITDRHDQHLIHLRLRIRGRHPAIEKVVHAPGIHPETLRDRAIPRLLEQLRLGIARRGRYHAATKGMPIRRIHKAQRGQTIEPGISDPLNQRGLALLLQRLPQLLDLSRPLPQLHTVGRQHILQSRPDLINQVKTRLGGKFL
ncbi:MAG: hypothetical protein CML13_04360 [Puniceicoccaceae bacterium]|nr:hypothetical protein [Puniceicoccaceae bacterium]